MFVNVCLPSTAENSNSVSVGRETEHCHTREESNTKSNSFSFFCAANESSNNLVRGCYCCCSRQNVMTTFAQKKIIQEWNIFLAKARRVLDYEWIWPRFTDSLSSHTDLAVNRCRMGKSVYAARNGMAANERAAIILERLTSEHRLVCAGQKKM